MTNIPKAKLKVFEFEFSRYIGENNIRFKYIIYYKYFTRLISVKKKKEKEELSNIFSNFYYRIYNISRAKTCVCVCVQPEPTISFYVDIRHAMFSYVINEGNSSRCLNEAMEKRKELPSREAHLEGARCL